MKVARIVNLVTSVEGWVLAVDDDGPSFPRLDRIEHEEFGAVEVVMVSTNVDADGVSLVYEVLPGQDEDKARSLLKALGYTKMAG